MRKLYGLFYKLFLVNSLCTQSPTFIWWPCRCYPETQMWYFKFQQEHWKRNAKLFMVNYPKPYGMGKHHDSSCLFIKMVMYRVTYHAYHTLCFPGEWYTLILVCENILIPIDLFDLSCGITYLSSVNSLFRYKPWCTTLSVRSCDYCG